ncbi:Exostoses (Multiple)-like 3 [Phlyctochytrium bullatum]|nr:Exostoses (Multiple)-like 3 [Phlyctochytrium bullatum]
MRSRNGRFLLEDDLQTRWYVGQTISAHGRLSAERDKERDPDLHVCLGHFPSQFDRDCAEMAGIAAMCFLMSKSSRQNASAFGRFYYIRKQNGQLTLEEKYVAIPTYRLLTALRTTFAGTAPPKRNSRREQERGQLAPLVDVFAEAEDSRALTLLQDAFGEIENFVDQFPDAISTPGALDDFEKLSFAELDEASEKFHNHPQVTTANVVCLLGYRPDTVIAGLMSYSGFFRNCVGECGVKRLDDHEEIFTIYLVSMHPGVIYYQREELSFILTQVLLLVPLAVEILGGCEERRLGKDELLERQNNYYKSEVSFEADATIPDPNSLQVYTQVKALCQEFQVVFDETQGKALALRNAERSGSSQEGVMVIGPKRASDDRFLQRQREFAMAIHLHPDFNCLTSLQQETIIDAIRKSCGGVVGVNQMMLLGSEKSGLFQRESDESLAMAGLRNRSEHWSQCYVDSRASTNGTVACLLCGKFSSNSLDMDKNGARSHSWGRAKDHFPRRSAYVLWLGTFREDTQFNLTKYALSSFRAFLENTTMEIEGREELLQGWAVRSEERKRGGTQDGRHFRRILKILSKEQSSVLPCRLVLPKRSGLIVLNAAKDETCAGGLVCCPTLGACTLEAQCPIAVGAAAQDYVPPVPAYTGQGVAAKVCTGLLDGAVICLTDKDFNYCLSDAFLYEKPMACPSDTVCCTHTNRCEWAWNCKPKSAVPSPPVVPVSAAEALAFGNCIGFAAGGTTCVSQTDLVYCNENGPLLPLIRKTCVAGSVCCASTGVCQLPESCPETAPAPAVVGPSPIPTSEDGSKVVGDVKEGSNSSPSESIASRCEKADMNTLFYRGETQYEVPSQHLLAKGTPFKPRLAMKYLHLPARKSIVNVVTTILLVAVFWFTLSFNFNRERGSVATSTIASPEVIEDDDDDLGRSIGRGGQLQNATSHAIGAAIASYTLDVYAFAGENARNFWESLVDSAEALSGNHTASGSSPSLKLHIHVFMGSFTTDSEEILASTASLHDTIVKLQKLGHTIDFIHKEGDIDALVAVAGEANKHGTLLLEGQVVLASQALRYVLQTLAAGRGFEAVPDWLAGVSLLRPVTDAVHNSSLQLPSDHVVVQHPSQAVMLSAKAWSKFAKWVQESKLDDPWLPNSLTNIWPSRDWKKHLLRWMAQHGTGLLFAPQGLAELQAHDGEFNSTLCHDAAKCHFEPPWLGGPFQTKNAYFEDVEHLEGMGGQGVARFDKCIMLMPVYSRISTLHERLSHYHKLKDLDSILLVWNNVDVPPNATELPGYDIPVIISKEAANSMNNRFRADREFSRDCLISMDDDWDMPFDHLQRATKAWRRYGFDQLIGYRHLARKHVPIGNGEYEYKHADNAGASMVLPSGLVFHRKMLDLFAADDVREARELVDEITNCEDILFNILAELGLARILVVTDPMTAVDLYLMAFGDRYLLSAPHDLLTTLVEISADSDIVTAFEVHHECQQEFIFPPEKWPLLQGKVSSCETLSDEIASFCIRAAERCEERRLANIALSISLLSTSVALCGNRPNDALKAVLRLRKHECHESDICFLVSHLLRLFPSESDARSNLEDSLWFLMEAGLLAMNASDRVREMRAADELAALGPDLAVRDGVALATALTVDLLRAQCRLDHRMEELTRVKMDAFVKLRGGEFGRARAVLDLWSPPAAGG